MRLQTLAPCCFACCLAYSVAAEPRTFCSTFVYASDPRLVHNSTIQVAGFLAAIKAMGVGHITLQQTSMGTAYPSVSGEALYPSKTFSHTGPDVVNKLLSAADIVGMNVSLGLMNPTNGGCMGGLFANATTASLSALATVYQSVAVELHDAYRQRHVSLVGLYITTEPDNVCLPEHDGPKLLGTMLLEPVARKIESLGLVSSVAPLFSTSWGGVAQQPAAAGAFWTAALSSAPSLSRVELQDKVSMNSMAAALPFIRAISRRVLHCISLFSLPVRFQGWYLFAGAGLCAEVEK